MNNNFNLNLKGIPKELLLIISIINKDAIENEKVLEGIDWKYFVELILHHRLYPYIYPILESNEYKVIPLGVIKRLEEFFKYNTFQMLHLSGEMDKLAKVFQGNDIKALFLKGPFLGNFIYGNVNLRTSSDLDILVPIDKLEKVEEIFINLGFKKDDYIKSVLNDWKWRHHHITFLEPKTNLKVEIHWRLNPGPSKEPTFNELWERREKCGLSPKYAFQLGVEDMFMFLVTHGARHGWSRLRWLLDIHHIVSKNINWRVASNLMKEYKYSQQGGQALILSSSIFKTKINEKGISSLTTSKNSRLLAQEAIFYMEKMVNLHTDPVPEEVAIYHKQHLFSLMSFTQKLLTVISYLHPYPLDTETLPLPKRLHLLYFPLRPLLWIIRKKSVS